METIQVDAPQSIVDTGIARTLIEDLALKTLFQTGQLSLVELAERMCLSLAVVEEVFSISHYAGPTPVTLEDYTERVRAQSIQGTQVRLADLERAFQKLVLSQELLSRLGTAISSGTSLFLYGPPGTGKTTIACNIPKIYNDFVSIPHAIEVDRQIISVFDPGVHERADIPEPEDWDKRWVICYRPRVVAGGEFSREMLDIQLNTTSRFFTAPLQLKANNGVLVLDDFGRQAIRPD